MVTVQSRFGIAPFFLPMWKKGKAAHGGFPLKLHSIPQGVLKKTPVEK